MISALHSSLSEARMEAFHCSSASMNSFPTDLLTTLSRFSSLQLSVHSAAISTWNILSIL